MKLHLNADLGEGESPRRTAAILRWVHAASIACGGHAGTQKSMQKSARLAAEAGVRVGAHPGFSDPENFGRLPLPLNTRILGEILQSQVSALWEVLDQEKLPLHHVKLHGALYHLVENRTSLAKFYVEWMSKNSPDALILCCAGGKVERAACEVQKPVWAEVFLDRGYAANGTLLPRTHPQALLERAADLKKRIDLLRKKSRIESADGTQFPIQAQTLCLHTDTPSAPRIAKLARKALDLTVL